MDKIFQDYMTATQRVKAFEPRQGKPAEDIGMLPWWVVFGILMTCALMVWDFNHLTMGDLYEAMPYEDFSDTGVGCIDDCLEPAE